MTEDCATWQDAALALSAIASLFAMVYFAQFLPWPEDSTDGSNMGE